MSSAIDEIRERLKDSLDEIAEVVGDPWKASRPQQPKPGVLKPSRALQELIKEGVPPSVLDAQASRRSDGRRVPLVLALVRDAAGRTRPGVPVHLKGTDGKILDRGSTGANGAVLLRFLRRAEDEDVKGEVDVVGHLQEDVVVPKDRQIVLLDLEVDPLPEVPGVATIDQDELLKAIQKEVQDAIDAAAGDGSTENGGGAGSAPDASAISSAASTAALTALGKQMQSFFGGTSAGDIFTRLPTDFSTEVCEATS